eukprot:733769-Pleurochrysis_carterae.AAC.1
MAIDDALSAGLGCCVHLWCAGRSESFWNLVAMHPVLKGRGARARRSRTQNASEESAWHA